MSFCHITDFRTLTDPKIMIGTLLLWGEKKAKHMGTVALVAGGFFHTGKRLSDSESKTLRYLGSYMNCLGVYTGLRLIAKC